MSRNSKLTNDEFIALRSIHREPWCSALGVLWKDNSAWLEVAADGWSRPAGTEGSYRQRADLLRRAHVARGLLQARGLVKEEIVPCCPEPTYHRGDYLLWTLTARGLALARLIYPNPTALKPENAVAAAGAGPQ